MEKYEFNLITLLSVDEIKNRPSRNINIKYVFVRNDANVVINFPVV